MLLARAGADIAVTDVAGPLATVAYALGSPDELAETARLVEAEGRRCLAIRADVTNAADMAAAAQQTVDELGRIEKLAAVAGLNALPVPMVESEDIAEAVLWLASDASGSVSGVALPVDAGLMVKM